ncbi:ATP-binding protein [Oceanospirillum beijerinckii]|uniref:ATP-binding protein n=1 Tax=Oceanospirillum beijerinckii TaxID=64976 RepID=UPI0004220C4C|nr:ATP-binding protein [Oceanospirillum beijerinckii]
MKKLPLAIETFAEIRENNYLYIDKTEHILRMVQSAKANFLSRPGRFGKSLLLDTMQQLFEGNQALFEGLYIANKWDWLTKYPVIKLDFSSGSVSNREELDRRMHQLLANNQQRLGLEFAPCEDSINYFEQLIRETHHHYQQKVVVLLDEYDRNILDNLNTPKSANGILSGLKGLYSVLKAQDAHIHFIFMTGITKSTKVKLFSGINQLVDISLDQRFSDICGFTQVELETQMAEHLSGVDWQQLRDWYGGYQFLGTEIFNPYAVMLFAAKDKQYRSYWFETGRPSFLLRLLQRHRYFLPDFEQLEVSDDILDSFDVEHINPVTLMFQKGYLALDKVYTDELGEQSYKLKIPNRDVRSALGNQLIAGYASIEEESKTLRQNLYRALSDGDLPALKHELIYIFDLIPWRSYKLQIIEEFKGFYTSVAYAFFSNINATVIPESTRNRVQIDMTVMLGDYIYVMEFKRDERKEFTPFEPNPALVQLKEKAYGEKYRHSGKTVFYVGLIFNSHERRLVQMDWEPLEPSPSLS